MIRGRSAYYFTNFLICKSHNWTKRSALDRKTVDYHGVPVLPPRPFSNMSAVCIAYNSNHKIQRPLFKTRSTSMKYLDAITITVFEF